MSAKKKVRHIQNNFRLTTKLLSDSNILPVSKVLLKNNFPTYELPLHNPNSRPKKKKTNVDCPPCPPAKDTDCPEPENNYTGQTSYLYPRSRYNPNHDYYKINHNTKTDKAELEKAFNELEKHKRKLYPRSKWEPRKGIEDDKNYFGDKQELDSYEIFGNSSLDESDYVDNTDFEDVDVERIKKKLESGKLTPQVENIVSKYGNNVVSPIINYQNISKKETFDTIEFAELIKNKLLNAVSKFDNKKVKTFFESHYTELKAEKYLKEIQESFEFALVMRSREISIEETTQNAFRKILELYNNQPVLNVRTSESIAKQAYSTPIPLGYLISSYSDFFSNTVYEPCAGNGSLTIASLARNVTVCEIDPIRIKHLEHLGYDVFPFSALDPATRIQLLGKEKFKRIVMNPPFGSYPSNQHIKINGRAITDIDQAIAIHSLQFLEPNGLAAIILGGHNLKVDKYGGFKANDQFFLNHIYRNYDVIKNIDINGDLYRKQGTSFDIRLIILRNSNTKEFKHVLPYDYSDKPGQILKANTWEDLYNILSEPYSVSATTHEGKKGESNEQQNNQSYTSNSSEASGELGSQRQRERIQTDERDFGDRRNQRQRIENNKGNDSKRDRRPDTQHETDGHRARRDDSNTERIGMPGGLDSSDTQDSVIDEEKFRKFAEFLKKAGL